MLFAGSLLASPSPEKLSDILFTLLSRSPEYSITFDRFLTNGPNSPKFKTFATALLSDKEIVDVVEGFYAGDIVWTKSGADEPWKISYKDERFKQELAEANTSLDHFITNLQAPTN